MHKPQSQAREPLGTLGPFALMRVLGGGPALTTYEALDPRSGERCLLRAVPMDPPAGSDAPPARLAERARAVASLQHPNLVAVLDHGTQDHVEFVASEWVEGETLDRYLARAGRLPPHHGLAIAAQLLGALHYAHERGVVHGALDHRVLWISTSGRLKVDGFVEAGQERASALLAPEQRPGRAAQPRSDLYAAALLAYELLTGATAFPPRADTDGPAMPTPRPVGEARPGLPPALDAVFLRALAPSPAARHASAGDLLAALQNALGAAVWDRTPAPIRVVPAAAAAEAPPLPTSSRAGTFGSVLAAFGGLAAVAFAVGWMLPLQSGGGDLQAQAKPSAVTAAPAPVPPAEAPSLSLRMTESPRLAPAAQPVGPPPLAEGAVMGAAAEPPRPRPAARRIEAPPAVVETEAAAPQLQAVPAAPPPAEPAPRRERIAALRGSASEPRPSRTADLGCREAPLGAELCQVLRCATAEFRQHPLCVRLHAEGRARVRLVETSGRL